MLSKFFFSRSGCGSSAFQSSAEASTKSLSTTATILTTVASSLLPFATSSWRIKLFSSKCDGSYQSLKIFFAILAIFVDKIRATFFNVQVELFYMLNKIPSFNSLVFFSSCRFSTSSWLSCLKYFKSVSKNVTRLPTTLFLNKKAKIPNSVVAHYSK